MKLRDALEACSAGLIRRIAERNRLVVEPETLRSELVTALSDLLPRRASDGGLWADLEPAARVAVDLVAARGRHERESLVRRLAWRLGFDGPAAGVDLLVEDLVERGLVYVVYHSGSSRAGTYYLIPDELRSTLPNPRPGGPLHELRSRSPAFIDPESDAAFDFFTLASALRRERWRALGRRLAGGRGRTLAQLFRSLQTGMRQPDGDGSTSRWRLLLRLGMELGALESSGWPTPDDERVAELLADRGELVAQLAATYLDRRVGSDRAVRPGRTARGHELGEAEREALCLLSELGSTAWYSLDEIAERIDREMRPWGSEGQPGPEVGPAIRRWADGPWRWLGLVRRGRDSDGDELLSVTRFGAALGWGEGFLGEPRRPDPCVLAPGLQLIASAGAGLDTLFRAERYLALEDRKDERRYRLTPASYARGLRQGGSPAEALALVERLIDQPAPAEWSDAMHGWEREVAFRLEPAFVLRADDPGRLELLASSPELDASIDERIGPHAVTVRPECLAGFLASMDANGWAVRVAQGLWLEPGRPGAAAAIGTAELLWVLLQTIETVAPGALSEIGGTGELTGVLESLVSGTDRRRLAKRVEVLARQLRAPPRRSVRQNRRGGDLV